VKDEEPTDYLVWQVEREVEQAHAWYYEVLANKKLRVNEGLGYACLRNVWAADARKLLKVKQFPYLDTGLVEVHDEAEVLAMNVIADGDDPHPWTIVPMTPRPMQRKPKNNPTGIKAPKCPRCKRGAS
jgi:hypothetical protein